MGLAHHPKIVTDGLVLSLDAFDPKAYPGSGTTWRDRSGNSNNGTLYNDTSFANKSMYFDGTDDYIEIPSSSSLQMAYNISISVWFKVPQNGLPFRQCLVGKHYTEYELGIYNGGYVHTYTSRGPDSSAYDEGCNIYHPDGNWQQDRWYCVVWTLENQTEKVYYEGVYKDSYTKPHSGTRKSTNVITIGNRTNNGGLRYKGDIAQVLIYNKTLTAEEVAQNFNATKSRFGL